MKRILLIISVILAAAALSFPSVLTGGIGLGLGTVSDSDLGDVYGSGFVVNPSLSFGISEQFALGIGYETGYAKEGEIGLFNDPAELKISGFQLFVQYLFKAEKLRPYLKLGYVNYTVKNSYTTEVMKQYDFSKSGSGVVIGGGAKYPLSGSFYLTGEVSYLLLKVKPFAQSINSGGLRLLVGLAVDFEL